MTADYIRPDKDTEYDPTPLIKNKRNILPVDSKNTQSNHDSYELYEKSDYDVNEDDIVKANDLNINNETYYPFGQGWNDGP